MVRLAARSSCLRQRRDFDSGLMASCLGKVIGALHPHERFGFQAKGLLEADRHIGRQAGMAVQDIAQVPAGNAEVPGQILHVDAVRFHDLPLEPRAMVNVSRQFFVTVMA